VKSLSELISKWLADENLHASGVFKCVAVLGTLLCGSFYIYTLAVPMEYELMVDVAPMMFYAVSLYLLLTPRSHYFAGARFYFLGVMYKVCIRSCRILLDCVCISISGCWLASVPP
jgi:hypothetical protein